MDNSNFLAYLSAGLLLIFVFAKYINRPNLNFIPAIGPNGILSSYIGAYRFITNGRQMVQQGYDKYPGSMFRIPLVSRWGVVLTSPELTNDLRNARDDEISFYDAVDEMVQTKFTMGQSVTVDHYPVGVIRTILTRNLGARFGNIYDEIVESFDDNISLKGNDWTAVPAHRTMLQVVCRTSNRLFVGLPLCREPTYLNLNIDFAVSVFKTATLINLFPTVLKPIIGPLISPLNGYLKQAQRYLGPIIEERLRQRAEYGDDWPDQPNDLITWLMASAPPHLQTVSDISLRVLSVNFGSIHTSADSITQALYHLAAEPHYIQPMREEVESVIKQEGWSKAAIDKLHKVDSFLRECQRYTGLGCLNMDRIIASPNGFKFSDGTLLPQGTLVLVASLSLHRDEKNLKNANSFEGFRYIDMPENGEGVKNHFSSTSPEYVAFGLGKHTCPGRFFAATELKAILAHIVVTYDVKLEDERAIPPGTWFGAFHSPNPSAKVLFRKRQ